MSMRVLLADSESLLTEMYRRALSGYGFAVAVAQDVSSCLAELRTFRPNVLVLDPDLCGGEDEDVLARLREENDLPLVPVILLCATYRPEYQAALTGLPASGCYQKPLLPNQLADRIQILLGCLSPFRTPFDLEVARKDEVVQRHEPNHRLRVLIVDDDQDTADTMSLLLERGGYEPAVAYSGPAALEMVRQLRPDVILCDLGLPGMDGLAVAAALRADPVTAGVRLIAVSGYGRDEDVQRSLAAGFEMHLTKPVDPELWPHLLAAHTVRE